MRQLTAIDPEAANRPALSVEQRDRTTWPADVPQWETAGVYGCGVEAEPRTRDFFGEGSPYLDDPLLTPERTAAEIDEVERLVGSVTGRVLDVGCGFGRHSIELASRFADVTGLDQSPTMIEAARSNAAAAGQFVDFVCMPASEFREIARYDLAICLFNTLGQQATAAHNDAPHGGLLQRTAKALRPGAKLVVELFDKSRAVPELIETEHIGSTKVIRSFDRRESTITERFRAASGDTYRWIYRVFEKTEIADLLYDTGFEVKQVIDGGLVEPPVTLMTFVAERRA